MTSKIFRILLTLCLITSLFTVPDKTVNAASFSPILPCDSGVVSTYYRYYNGGSPKTHGTRTDYRNAIDMTGNTGDPLYAVEQAKVVEKSFQSSGFGHYIVIEFANGLRALYGHMLSASPYNVGDKVQKGTVIGFMGSTGNSSGTHVHFEVYNPNNPSQITDPLMTYYKGRFALTIGYNSYRANKSYTGKDKYTKAYVSWLSTLEKNRDGDFVSPAGNGSSYNVSCTITSSKYIYAFSNSNASGYVGRVFPGDKCEISQVLCDGEVIKLTCPWDSSYKTVYVRTRDFFFKATKYINAYSGVNGSKVGRVYPGDNCRLLAIQNGYAKVLCPWDNGTNKIIYVYLSDLS